MSLPNFKRDPTRRFGDRVADYVAWRPGYPADVVVWLRNWGQLQAGMTIADVGAGTGIFSALLLDADLRVNAVEPNDAMRAAAERTLSPRDGYASFPGRAEATGLPDASVDAVVAAQAFHWFDPDLARAEWRRILRPGRGAALIWNRRRIDFDDLQRGYEALLIKHCPEYPLVGVEHTAERNIAAFFGPGGYVQVRFPSAQTLDWPGLRGRACSSSYVPGEGHPERDAFLLDLRELFNRYADAGRVTLRYETIAFGGRWS